MMMSPESYYEYCLKGKSEKEILSEIRKLKRSISRLKRTMEHPEYYNRNVIIDPSEGVRIHLSREYYDISRFGYMVLDGKHWDLEIVYSDGHKPVKIAGCNSYPYNFWELISLLKADDIFAEE